MALRAVPEHPKFARLKKSLGISKFEALGLLEALWHFTGKFAPRGNVGKFTNEEIESWVEWNGEPGMALSALISAGWIDEDSEFRLAVHDWKDHADATTKKYMGRTKAGFVQDVSEPNGKSSGPPEPVPVPVPEPVKKEQKTSRAKAASDSRHIPFKLACEAYATYKGVEFSWGPGDAGQMALLLSSTPGLTLATFQRCLNHRAKSVVTHGDKPMQYLPTILKFQEGPLDEFGKPQGAGNVRNYSKTAGNVVETEGAFAILAEADRNLRDAHQVQSSQGGGDEQGDLSHLRTGSIELRS